MKKFFALAVLSIVFLPGFSQLTVNTNQSGLQLAQYLAGGGVNISNLVLNCPNGGFGQFTGGGATSMGINEGVILTSGTAIELPNQANFASQDNFANGDADLDAILATYPTITQSQDACILEFDIQVNGDSLNFNYVFGSEEYPSFTCSNFTDIFAFLITGPNPGGGNYNKQNIALIPGTNLPVSINTVNSGQPSGGNPSSNCVSLAYSSFFVANPTIVYDGHTTVFTASIATIPCQTYRLKLAIADAGDGILDSGVMLQAYSFTAANIKITPGTNGNPLFVNAVEGCSPSGFVLAIDRVLTDTFTISYAIGGTATEGVDYTTVPKSVTLAPGDTTAIVLVDPAFDGVSEGLESVKLYLLNPCDNQPYDSAVIFIQDSIVAAATSPDQIICRGETTQIFGSGGLDYQWSPALGLSDVNVYNPFAFPQSSIRYYVTVSVGPCTDVDSIDITVLDPLFSVNAGADDTLCLNEAVTIPLQVTGNQQPYSFNWTPGVFLNDSTIQNPVTAPRSSITYEVVVTGANGCTQRDTIRYFISGVGPVVKIEADKNDVCKGDTIQLTSTIFPLSCGLNLVPCSGSFAIGNIGNGTVQSFSSPFGGINGSNQQRTKMLYRAADIGASINGSVTISDIVFNVLQQGTFDPFDNFTVKMGCTDKNELNDFESGLLTVYSGSYILTGNGPNTITLNNAYDWDGNSNLIIEICYDMFNFPGFDVVLSETKNYNAVIQGTPNFNEPPCDAQFGFTSFDLPNIQFIYCQEAPKNYTFQWVPTTNLLQPDSLNTAVVLNQNTTYVLNVSDSICNGSGFIDLKLANYGVFAGNDTAACLPAGSLLNGVITGNPPVIPLTCGVNGTACNSPSQYTVSGAPNNFPFVTPFDGFNEDVRHQYLYRQSDLQATGLTAGTISNIAFNVTNKQSFFPFQNFRIKIACTDVQSLDFNLPDWIPTTQVYSASTVITTPGWNQFNLTNTFDWDGNSNIVVEVCWDNPDLSPPNAIDEVQTINTTYSSSFTASNSFDVGCDLPLFFGFNNVEVPAIRFGACPPPAVVPSIVWSPATGLSNPNILTPVATPAQATTYVLTADFPGGCVKTDTITVTPQQVVYTPVSDTTICSGTPATLLIVTSDSVSWLSSPALSCIDCPSPTATPIDSTVFYYSVISSGGCIVSDSVLVNVITVDATVSFADTLVDQGTTVQLFSNGTGGDGNFSFVWQPADYLDNANSQNPVATPLENKLYTVTVSSLGCTDTASVNVRVNIIESPVEMPNAFTPNGDGRNDLFGPVFGNGSLATVKEFRIYDRWGAMVHNSTAGWDGRFKGKDQPAGTYIYYVVIQRPLQDDEGLQGSVTLLR